jgi:hypothetical protein
MPESVLLSYVEIALSSPEWAVKKRKKKKIKKDFMKR